MGGKHPVFWVIHLMLLGLLAYAGTGLFYRSPDQAADRPEPGSGISGSPSRTPGSQARPGQVKAILDRNLFNVRVSSQDTAQVRESGPGSGPVTGLKPTQLDLALWGTVTGGSRTWAVIEDRKEKAQALYQVGDTVAGAVIKEIRRNQVVLTHDHQDQLLEVDMTQKPLGMAESLPSPVVAQDPARFPFRGGESPAADTPLDLMKQARIRPFFRQGEPQGLLLYGIKSGSPFEQMGLKNGDIVQAVNETPTLSAMDARTVYQNTASGSDARIRIIRRGEPMELVYTASDRTVITGPVKND